MSAYNNNVRDESPDMLVLPAKSPRRYFGSKYYKAPMQMEAATGIPAAMDQLDLSSIHRPMRSPPAKLSTPRSGEDAPRKWGSLGNIRRRSPCGTPRPEQPVGIAAVDFEADSPTHPSADALSRSVTAPVQTVVQEEVPAFRHDPYNQHVSRMEVPPLLIDVVHAAPAAPKPSGAQGKPLRPPLAPSRSDRQPVLSSLQLSNLRKHRDPAAATPRVTTPHTNRSMDSPHSGEKGGGCGLSTIGETPRSARTNPTPRSASSTTPRDLPESIDGPYRHLGGLGVSPQPGEVLPTSTPRGMTARDSPRIDPMVRLLPAPCQGKNVPLPPEGTLHQSLMTVVDFCLYPTQAFPLNPSKAPSPPRESLVRMFIGQLPYNVTDMQLAWMAYAFGGGVTLHYLEKITKMDRSKKKQLPTGCYHFYVEPHHVDPLMVGLHKKLMVDDTGIWIAQDENQDRILKIYTEEMKIDKTKRFVGRPYGTVVIQHSTSNFDPEAPVATQHAAGTS